MLAGISHAFAVTFQSIQLIFVQLLTIKQQTANQSGFSIIYRTRRQKTE